MYDDSSVRLVFQVVLFQCLVHSVDQLFMFLEIVLTFSMFIFQRFVSHYRYIQQKNMYKQK